jgi:sarcosine oxidase
MSERYDAIVIGLGAMGSAATYHLARRGHRVLGLELFEPGHDQGSSHGHHRMIRRSSGSNNPLYSPLADRAMELWRELESESGRQLLTITGEVRLVDTRMHPNHPGNIERMVAEGHWEVLDEASLAERFPGFRLDDGIVATHEADAGFLRSEAGILAHLERARAHDATIRTGEEVAGWTASVTGVTVSTTHSEYSAERLIITTGPWAGELLADLNLPLHPVRVINAYFQPDRPDLWTVENGAPNFSLSVAEGGFYGVPALRDEGVGFKIGPSGDISHPRITPRNVRRTIDDSEIEPIRVVLDRYLPGSAGRELKRITCITTYTSDDEFIVGRLPEHERVVIGCGFCGRGYKFAPTVGEILADLTIDGRTSHDIAFMSVARFQGQGVW